MLSFGTIFFLRGNYDFDLTLIPLLLLYGYVATIGLSMSKDRYKFRLAAALLCLILSIIFEFYIYEKGESGYMVMGLLPLLHIIYYEILRKILRPFIGDYPYTPYRDKIGARVNGTGYPKNRKVKVIDYAFGFILLILPPITSIYLSISLDEYLELYGI